MINMRALIKVFVAMLLMGGIFTTAQAGSTMTIGANLAYKIVIDVTAGASQTWTLDPQIGTSPVTVVNALTVSCNKASWTVTASSDNTTLKAGTNSLASPFTVQAIASGGQTWSSSAPGGSLWVSGGKGTKLTDLIFTQPVSWADEGSGTPYGAKVTLTAAII
jgi:hypothetical protein